MQPVARATTSRPAASSLLRAACSQAPFIPSKHEAKQVMRMVMAMRSESYQKSVANRKKQDDKDKPNYQCAPRTRLAWFG